MKLKNRRAIVTGAGRGLGAEIARRFVAEGASVLLCARSDDELTRTLDEITPRLGQGQKALARRCDITSPADVDQAVSVALETFGTLDILVNNAAVQGPMGRLEDVAWQAWVDAVAVDLIGTAYFCRAVVPHFRMRRYGKIINLSGGGATSPLPGFTAYAASKAAIVRFTETLAHEVMDDRIDVNAIAPGVLATRLLDEVIAAGPERIGADYHRRMVNVKNEGGASLETAAALCAYLASAESDGITGKLIAAQWDPWPDLHQHLADLAHGDVYTLRRILPKDRGLAWGDE